MGTGFAHPAAMPMVPIANSRPEILAPGWGRPAAGSRSASSCLVQTDDASLVEAVRAGRDGAEELFYARFVPATAGLVARLLRSREDAEDLTQDTFIAAMESLHQLRDSSAVRPWLTQIAVHLVHRGFRKRRLLRALGLDRKRCDDASLARLASHALSAEARAELALLDRSLEALPDKHRVAWMLRRVEGMRIEEVAVACRCSAATAKRWIAAADQRVQEHVGIRGEDDE